MKLSELLDRWGADGPVAVALHREWLDPEVVAHFTIDGEPQSKSRARITTKNGKVTAYTPRQTELAEGVVAWKFRSAATVKQPQADKTFGVFAAFICGTRQRRDVDNMLKLILDGLNKVAWADDSQVTEVSARLVRGAGADLARTEVIVYETSAELTGGLMGTVPCKQCGAPCRTYNSVPRSYCGKKCHDDARRLHSRMNCERCGESFKGKGKHRRFCSAQCRAASMAVSLTCPQCGVTFTKPPSVAARTKHCGRACSLAARRVPDVEQVPA